MIFFFSFCPKSITIRSAPSVCFQDRWRTAKGVYNMAKINKYWGMVALGAVTAAAAGAVAATFAKRRALEQAADAEDDFEDEQETSSQPEKRKFMRISFPGKQLPRKETAKYRKMRIQLKILPKRIQTKIQRTLRKQMRKP